jgi:hypothetical protein
MKGEEVLVSVRASRAQRAQEASQGPGLKELYVPRISSDTLESIFSKFPSLARDAQQVQAGQARGDLPDGGCSARRSAEIGQMLRDMSSLLERRFHFFRYEDFRRNGAPVRTQELMIPRTVALCQLMRTTNFPVNGEFFYEQALDAFSGPQLSGLKGHIIRMGEGFPELSKFLTAVRIDMGPQNFSQTGTDNVDFQPFQKANLEGVSGKALEQAFVLGARIAAYKFFEYRCLDSYITLVRTLIDMKTEGKLESIPKRLLQAAAGPALDAIAVLEAQTLSMPHFRNHRDQPRLASLAAVTEKLFELSAD